MSSSRALWCLLSVKKQKRDFFLFRSMHNKTILDSVFVTSRIIKVSVRVIIHISIQGTIMRSRENCHEQGEKNNIFS